MSDIEIDSELSDEQMDSLINQPSESREIPMRQETVQTPQEYSLKVGGKEIKAPLDKVLNWAQMGYDYPQKAAALKAEQEKFNQQRSQFENQWKETEQKWSPYKEIDEYAAKNPDWWSQVQEQYKQKIAGAQTNPEIQALKQELQEIKDFKNEIQNEKKTKQIEQEDSQLATEIDTIRKQYPWVDFTTPNDEGKSLEMRVLEHAATNGINSFRVAYRDLAHDDLLNKAREEGKELVSKEVQKRTKLGILGETSKPTRGLKVAENVRDKSYGDLEREALEELGIKTS